MLYKIWVKEWFFLNWINPYNPLCPDVYLQILQSDLISTHVFEELAERIW